MKGFPKILKTKADYYNCLKMVSDGELTAEDLLGKIESLERQRYIQCAVVEVAEGKKAATIYYCDEAAVNMKFRAGDIAGTITAVTHNQSEDAKAAEEKINDRTVLTLSKDIPAENKVIELEIATTAAGMTKDDISALKGVLKQYE